MIPNKVLSLEQYMKELADKVEYPSVFHCRSQAEYEARFTKAVREHKRICKELGVKVL